MRSHGKDDLSAHNASLGKDGHQPSVLVECPQPQHRIQQGVYVAFPSLPNVVSLGRNGGAGLALQGEVPYKRKSMIRGNPTSGVVLHPPRWPRSARPCPSPSGPELLRMLLVGEPNIVKSKCSKLFTSSSKLHHHNQMFVDGMLGNGPVGLLGNRIWRPS